MMLVALQTLPEDGYEAAELEIMRMRVGSHELTPAKDGFKSFFGSTWQPVSLHRGGSNVRTQLK
jgi:hypothetical protein